MGAKNAAKVLPIDEANVNGKDKDEKKPKTSKKVSKDIEKATRKLDNVLSDLVRVEHDFIDIRDNIVSTDVDPKDEDRLHETVDVLHAANQILFYLTHRMARKHVGKTIEPVDLKKRQSLKK